MAWCLTGTKPLPEAMMSQFNYAYMCKICVRKKYCMQKKEGHNVDCIFINEDIESYEKSNVKAERYRSHQYLGNTVKIQQM